MCHCKYAAIKPEASRRERRSLSTALFQSPVIKLDISSRVSGEGVAAADGLQVAQTLPPPTKEKYLCGPGSSHLEHVVIDGAKPATPSDRRRYASKISDES
jgi:hypothetical protein